MAMSLYIRVLPIYSGTNRVPEWQGAVYQSDLEDPIEPPTKLAETALLPSAPEAEEAALVLLEGF